MDQAIPPTVLRRRNHIRLAIGVLLCAGVCTAAWGIHRRVRPGVDSADIVVAEVRRGNVDNTIEAAGVVIPVHEEVVSSPGASRIARVHAKPGQQVQAGELLLELDDRTIRLALEALKEQLAQQDNRVTTLTLDSGGQLDATPVRQLFTPFFSTKKGGQGIGLMFVRAVLTRHGCRYALAPGADDHTRFDIWFDAASS